MTNSGFTAVRRPQVQLARLPNPFELRIQSPDSISTHALPASTLRLAWARDLGLLLDRLLSNLLQRLALSLHSGSLLHRLSLVRSTTKVLPRAAPSLPLLLRPRAPAGDIRTSFLPRRPNGRLCM